VGLDQLSGYVFGTVLFLVAIVALFYLKRELRSRLLPSKKQKERGQALAELLHLQAKLESEAEGAADPPGEEGAS
jgi:hypothetical protein